MAVLCQIRAAEAVLNVVATLGSRLARKKVGHNRLHIGATKPLDAQHNQPVCNVCNVCPCVSTKAGTFIVVLQPHHTGFLRQ